MFSPSSQIKLLRNVDITNDYTNTFSFGSKAEQTNFFMGKVKHTFDSLSYQRKERTIKVELNIESLFDCNYLMFQNTNYSNKWFYAFITDMRYISEDVTELLFEIDVIQTWYFDIEMKNCYVEREHVADDSIGKHLVEENLNVGEYKIRSMNSVNDLNALAIVIATTSISNGTGGFVDTVGENYSGIYSGVKYIAFSSTNSTAVSMFIADITSKGKADAIQSIFLMPKILIPNFVEGGSIDAPMTKTFDYVFPKNHADIDGYIPKNKKLFCYPYNFLYVSNHNGGFAVFRYELTSQPNLEFLVGGNISPNPTVFLVPKAYKGIGFNYDESLTMTNFPICNWVSDLYSNWVAQNAITAPLSVASSALALGVGISTANPIAIGAGAIGVANSIGSFFQTAIQPNQARGQIGGGATVSMGIQKFGVYPKTISKEFARIIDDYFTRFGYKVNELKTPSIRTRPNWNYLKLLETNIFGAVPNIDLKKIQDIYRNGITFWHNDNVGNYNRPN